jgi:hypothetical protein
MAWVLLTCSLLLVPTYFSIYYYYKYKQCHYEYEMQSYLHSLQLTKDILDDLQLATSQQLLNELKVRPNAEIVVLQKQAGGLSMEICGLSVTDCPKLLQEAYLLAKEACQRQKFF